MHSLQPNMSFGVPKTVLEFKKIGGLAMTVSNCQSPWLANPRGGYDTFKKYMRLFGQFRYGVVASYGN